ncbi:MAG: hypothetical protein QGH90_01840 [Candidatus Poseidoniaceae archaeon]|jgi:ribonuclease HI|nr:hypothetical protein [Candidatus Poseidoniaceae archaeon]MDP7000623.1 hypothetical protein [Candidatus Poseidoniaceae archaeon]
MSIQNHTIYVDGSCLGNQNVDANTPAGWGYVVVVGDTGLGKGVGELLIENFGKVITDNNNDDFIGAEIGSNNTGELSAFAHALRWILTNQSDGEYTIRTDSTYAGNIADGTWKAKANLALVKRVRSLWNEVGQLYKLSWNHVKAHRGHRWNERADHLASRAAAGELPIPFTFWKPGQR